MKCKLKAIWKIITCDEFFVTTAKQHNPYGDTCDGPIKYDYQTNTERDIFFFFIKKFLSNNYDSKRTNI
jgi:hypothetical protein